ncbi:uncharacterized protein LOC127265704 [Andrographis paniculata]|uniref:uncharacterized protein LOC127265704 n=1 Tax=Andrographis paniculata TaxID=175694 RepID=UPI0021E80C34|nr:uncharacterized protein LOC127265704 [Andrographis paniculata]
MDSACQAPVQATRNAACVSMVDPFLVEALQNPRHRLTILRMELDIQRLLRNSDQQQFEFPHFPTSYLRLAAHRVAQHYGLQTMVQDNPTNGQVARILVTKTPETKFPAVCLSDIQPKLSENDKLNQSKIVIRTRPKSSFGDSNDPGFKRSPVRTVEERKEEYDRARARIFSSPSHSELEDGSVQNEVSRNMGVDANKILCRRETVNSYRVAIFRDHEKDRTDPDYDRSYDRYVKSTPSFNVAPYNAQMFQPPFMQYNSQAFGEAFYMQWPTQSMMYAQSYGQLRHNLFQAPLCRQPLGFDYSLNHR